MTVATYNEVGCLTPLKQFFLLNPQNSYLKIVPYFSSLNFSSWICLMLVNSFITSFLLNIKYNISSFLVIQISFEMLDWKGSFEWNLLITAGPN